MMGISVLFAFIGSFAGLLFSFYVDIPSGASIIFTLVLVFGLMKLAFYFRQNLFSRD
jgi:zinc transport system permease protein